MAAELAAVFQLLPTQVVSARQAVLLTNFGASGSVNPGCVISGSVNAGCAKPGCVRSGCVAALPKKASTA
jgi:hypothetical protein